MQKKSGTDEYDGLAVSDPVLPIEWSKIDMILCENIRIQSWWFLTLDYEQSRC